MKIGLPLSPAEDFHLGVRLSINFKSPILYILTYNCHCQLPQSIVKSRTFNKVIAFKHQIWHTTEIQNKHKITAYSTFLADLNAVNMDLSKAEESRLQPTRTAEGAEKLDNPAHTHRESKPGPVT
ncbi:hypothetical protein KC19_1G008700 [Ceratodon purpureus]|uniref:Uncharacterized protein n=1 Tax=Ceratodon purpureus TaxID=3225 RepID=A0A8T0J217_CERPU|nr:hypothetical protein KC19_1G008700 [Ceratodon purpureus]